MQHSRPHSSQLRAERAMRNRRCNALTLGLDALAMASELPAVSHLPAWQPELAPGNDDVFEMARGAIGNTDHAPPASPTTTTTTTTTWQRFDNRSRSRSRSRSRGHTRVGERRSGPIDWIFEDGRCWTDDDPDALEDVTSAPSTPSSASPRASVSVTSDDWVLSRSPSPVDQPSSVPTTPEAAPRPRAWGSFQRFSFQKAPARPVSGDSSGDSSSVSGAGGARHGGEGASAAAGGAWCADRATNNGPGAYDTGTDTHKFGYAAARSGTGAVISAQAPAPDRATSTSTPTPTPAQLKRSPSRSIRGRFLASVVTVVPVTAKATCITLSNPTTPSEPPGRTTGDPPPNEKHELPERPSHPPMQTHHPPESQPAGAITPAGDGNGTHPHEQSIAQQLHDALEDSIATGSDDDHVDAQWPAQWPSQSQHHADPPARHPHPLSRTPLPPSDDPFNFSRPAAPATPTSTRGPPRSTAPSPIATPHPDVLTPGKASAPTSPTNAHFSFLASTAPPAAQPSPRMQNPLYHGSGYPREPLARARAAESTASFRSHGTASTAPATCATERSSVTRGTSVTSVASVDDEEPIVDEVMRMYEKGFYDDTDEEEEEQEREPEKAPTIDTRRGKDPLSIDTRRGREPLTIDSRPPTATSGYSLTAAAHPLAANPVVQSAPASPLSSHPPLSPLPPALSLPSSPPLPTATPPADAETPVDPRPAFSPIPEDLPPVAWPRRPSENRDSGKSMGDCETQSAPEATPPHAPTSITSPNLNPAAPEEDPDSRDRYGFKKANQYVTREAYDAWNATYTPYLDRRRWKWVAFMRENNLSTDHPNRFPPPSAKTKRFVRKGIPPEWRGAAWFYYAGGPAILGRHAGLYDRLLRKSPSAADADIIERDLHRTFPDNEAFRPPGTSTATGGEGGPEPPMISALRRVLRAFSIHNPKIGYCQSLNFIAGLLLLFVPTEEQAFWLLNIVTLTLLPGTHETSLEGSKVDLGVLMTAIRSNMPELWEKLAGDEDADVPRPGTAKSHRHRPRRRDVTPITKDRLPPITITMAAWFMSCFIGTLPTEPTLRVWDVFFYEGSKTLFRAALAILKVGEAQIGAVEDPMEMFAVVQGIPRGMLDANGLLETCFKKRGGFGGVGQGVVDDGRREMRGGEERRGFFRRRRKTDVGEV